MSPALLSFRFNNSDTRSRLRSSSTHTDRPTSLWSSHGYGVEDHDPFAAVRSLPRDLNDSPRPSTAGAASTSSRRSLLMSASDALGFKFHRRKQPVYQHPAPVILPEVMEITARKRDEDEEERNRLREEAAQAIGLDPALVNSDMHSHLDTTDEDELGDGSRPAYSITSATQSHLRNSTYSITPHPMHGSTTSVSVPPVARYRSSSLLQHSRASSANLTPIPPYPSTITSLSPFQQQAASIPKYYQPSSLRIFALNSKNWKSRYIILTSPATIVTRNRTPAVSYLHLFRDSGQGERELERLEINEDSVVFVSDDEVSGRRHVVKVGGVEVGSVKKEFNSEEPGTTLWFLQLDDPTESQQWISSIKNSILNQRAIRAGLLPTTTVGVNEPRGDIDVVLSMRAQGFISAQSNHNLRQHNSTPPSTVIHAEKNYASSISSHSISQLSSPPKVPGPVSTLKGLFSGTRPRSGSRATADIKPQHEPNEDANNAMSSRMSTVLNTPEVQLQPTAVVRANSPFSPSVNPDIDIDRKIVSDPDQTPMEFATNEPQPLDSTVTGRETKALSLGLGSMSLQPPPRKRWTTTAVSPLAATFAESTTPLYQNVQYNDTTGSLGALTYYKDQEPPSSPTHTSGSTSGTPDQRNRAPSLQSVSTYGSNENSNFDKSSSGTRRRWSRHGPPKMSPPSGPPPNPPVAVSRPQLMVESIDSNRSESRTRSGSRASSTRSGQSQQSVLSSLPSFSKRASVSSVGTSSTSHSNSTGNSPYTLTRPNSHHRTSIPPPPRPEPTSALPPAPGEKELPHEVISNTNLNMVPSKSKRGSITGRGFRLSMIAPKPPPSTNLPPRPDEVDSNNTLNPGTTTNTHIKLKHNRPLSSAGSNRLSRLNSIPGSPDPGASGPGPAIVKISSPLPEPRGPLPPTPTSGLLEGSGNGNTAIDTNNNNSTNNNTRSLSVLSRHASLKQRLRILSAPSSPSSPLANTTNSSNLPSTSLSSNNASRTHTHTNSSFTSRLSVSGLHHNHAQHARALSVGGIADLHKHNRGGSLSISPPPYETTTAAAATISSPSGSFWSPNSQPSTPIGEKITLFQDDPSFLQSASSRPLPSINPLSSSSQPQPPPLLKIPTSINIRPLPAIPTHVEMTPLSLSPPPRRNSKPFIFLDSPTTTTRTPPFVVQTIQPPETEAVGSAPTPTPIVTEPTELSPSLSPLSPSPLHPLTPSSPSPSLSFTPRINNTITISPPPPESPLSDIQDSTTTTSTSASTSTSRANSITLLTAPNPAPTP